MKGMIKMAYQELVGNIFNSKASTLVNTVNCVGAMGKGIALEFRRRYPEMFRIYQDDCNKGKLKPGNIYPYPQSDVLILNFAIKDNWKYPSKLEWIENSLRQFTERYREYQIKTVAFPWMGAMNGGIPLSTIQKITRNYLQSLTEIDIEVYSFDPDAPDPLFSILVDIASIKDPSPYQKISGLQKKAFDEVIAFVRENRVNSLPRLIDSKIIGDTSIDKLYQFLTKLKIESKLGEKPTYLPNGTQLTLF